MAGPNALTTHPPEFERFLYASVGEDQNGYALAVRSTLARLDLDPWAETADLATLGHDGSRARLRTLLARFRDVPTLVSDHVKFAQRLSHLPPKDRTSGSSNRAATTVTESRQGTNGEIWAVLAITLMLFQMFIVGGSRSGE